jgi:hypothetical protein
MWGLITRRWSLTFLDRNEARAMIHIIDKTLLDVKRSIPAWKIDDAFIVELENCQSYCYSLIFSSTMRSGGSNAINERLALSKQVSENVSNPAKDSRRKSIFPWG